MIKNVDVKESISPNRWKCPLQWSLNRKNATHKHEIWCILNVCQLFKSTNTCIQRLYTKIANTFPTMN